LFSDGQAQLGEAAQQRVEGHLQLKASELGAETVVGAEAEREV
jgi:hypothetical protein